jgi:hypothetical protein
MDIADLQLAIERRRSEDGSFVTAPREHGQRNGDGNVDPDLASFDGFFKLARGRARLCEDGRAVPVL